MIKRNHNVLFFINIQLYYSADNKVCKPPVPVMLYAEYVGEQTNAIIIIQ